MTTYQHTAFRRRVYSLSGFFSDIFIVVGNARLAFKAMWGKEITQTFRQRLMLAVTGVNGCRYCSYLHTKEALRAGLDLDEINQLLGGAYNNVPEQELKAILYAQHWADTNAHPDTQAKAKLIADYGEAKIRIIEMALVLIRIGNLSGNSFDYFLYTITCGRKGLTTRDG